jgi:hypothetical protein
MILFVSVMQIPVLGPPFLIAQSAKDVAARGVPRGSEPAHHSHDQGKANRADHHQRRHLQAEHNFAERHLVRHSRSHAVEWQHQQDSERRA